MIFQSKNLDALVKKRQKIEDDLVVADPGSKQAVALSRELSGLTPVVEEILRYQQAKKELEETEALLMDEGSTGDLWELANAERFSLVQRCKELERAIQLALLPKDEADEKNAILEIRAGTGGDEAALFAQDLFVMYQRYAQIQNWPMEILSMSESLQGGFKEVIAEIRGKRVFSRLKFESGVHRVQRVPATEASGRVHTSAATVAVLPEAEEVDYPIEEADLQIDTMRAGGAGGQHVNKTDSAVRIKHKPTGIVVVMQEERSQHRNKIKAFSILRSRLYERERLRIQESRAAERKGQIGTGDRSERIRTYNFLQGRVTDHRISLTLYKLEQMMQGTLLDEIVDALTTYEQASYFASEERKDVSQ